MHLCRFASFRNSIVVVVELTKYRLRMSARYLIQRLGSDDCPVILRLFIISVVVVVVVVVLVYQLTNRAELAFELLERAASPSRRARNDRQSIGSLERKVVLGCGQKRIG